jgi:hypothetical protein
MVVSQSDIFLVSKMTELCPNDIIMLIDAMVTTRPINHQYTFISSWSVLCFEVLLLKHECVECNHTFRF